MNNVKLFRAVGGVGDDLIARADEPVAKTGDKMWYRIAALAACAALVIGVGAFVLPNFRAKSAAPAAQSMAAEETGIAEEAADETDVEAPTSEEAAVTEEKPVEEPAKNEPKAEEKPPVPPKKEEKPESQSEPEKKEEPVEDAPKEKEPEADVPDPEPLNRLILFDQNYKFVSKSRAESKEKIFDDEKIGTWWSVMFSGEDIYRYGSENVTGENGTQYPANVAVIYGRTVAVYEYAGPQEKKDN